MPAVTVTATRPAGSPAGIVPASQATGAGLLQQLGVTAAAGLSSAEAARRLVRWGPNAVSSHRARLLPVLWHQLRSPLLVLLTAAVASYFTGERSDAVIIGVIVGLSVGLGFVNEYRAEKAAEALHSQIRHQAIVVRDGRPVEVDVTALVPGDLVELRLGDIVPADIRLLEAADLECEESVLTGESLPTEKDTSAVSAGTPLAELSGCALMGTVVSAGSGRGVVAATGARTEFGKIAAGLGTHPLDTEFQSGLRRFSMLLVYVAGALTTSIFVINVALHKPVIDALLFSLAIAVGITPQLLPAVVSSSLAAGSWRMSRLKVLVKRLVCIEDIGDVDVLFTDKTGTLTLGRIDYMRAVPAAADRPDGVLRWGLLCTENMTQDGQAVGGNPLDQALWQSPAARPSGPRWPDTSGSRYFHSTTSGAWSPSSSETKQASTFSSLRAHRSPSLTAAPRWRPRRGMRSPASSRQATGLSPWRLGPPARHASSAPPTSAAYDWPGCWCSSTRPSRMPPIRCSASPAWASPSRSSPATTPRSPSKCAKTSGWPPEAR
jgi:Mg2+-importing ATPase